jgi:hypothetical protein
MTADDLTVHEGRPTGTIPAPRGPRAGGPDGDAVLLGHRPGRHTRPPEEFWDVATARWVTRSPVPGQRRG